MNEIIHWYIIYYIVNTRNISILESQLFTDFLTLEIFTTNKIVYLEEGKSRKQNLKVDDAFLHLAEEGYTRVNDVSQIMQPIRFEITKMCCFDDMK